VILLLPLLLLPLPLLLLLLLLLLLQLLLLLGDRYTVYDPLNPGGNSKEEISHLYFQRDDGGSRSSGSGSGGGAIKGFTLPGSGAYGLLIAKQS